MLFRITLYKNVGTDALAGNTDFYILILMLRLFKKGDNREEKDILSIKVSVPK